MRGLRGEQSPRSHLNIMKKIKSKKRRAYTIPKELSPDLNRHQRRALAAITAGKNREN